MFFYPDEKRISYFNALKNFKSLTVHLKLESTLEDRYRHEAHRIRTKYLIILNRLMFLSRIVMI